MEGIEVYQHHNKSRQSQVCSIRQGKATLAQDVFVRTYAILQCVAICLSPSISLTDNHDIEWLPRSHHYIWPCTSITLGS
jgi:hypothetical protein